MAVIDVWDEPVELPKQENLPVIKIDEDQFNEEAEPKESLVVYGDLPEHTEPGLKDNFYITQSLIKVLVDKNLNTMEYCGRFIYHVYVVKTHKRILSDPMLEGMYGEYLILGHNAKGEVNAPSLRKHIKTGSKRVVQERIEMQADRFNHYYSLLYQLNIIPGVNTQVPIFKKFGKGNVILRGEIDLFPTSYLNDTGLNLAAVDIKFTGDVNSNFGKYAWGSNEIDFIQGDMYHFLLRDFDYELNAIHGHNFHKRVGYKNIMTESVKSIIDSEGLIFLYFVMGYKKSDINNQVKLIERSFRDPKGTDFRQKELEQRIRMTLGILSHEHQNGWAPNPSPSNCKDCPLRTDLGGPCNEYLKPIKS